MHFSCLTCNLRMQVEEMQIQHEEEARLRALKCEAEVEVLKQEIANSFAQFSSGTIGARELLVRSTQSRRTPFGCPSNCTIIDQCHESARLKVIASRLHATLKENVAFFH